ncbi:MAG TPA: hypothetical protein VIL10_05445 [Marmoricola sp.]|jgi:hypothetical protein
MPESPDRLLLRLVMVTRRVIDVAGLEMLDEAERQVLRDVSRYLRTKYGSRTPGGDDDRGVRTPEPR